MQTLTLKIKGIWTNSNEFSEIPDGALSLASNIVLSKDSVAESRRGFEAVFTSNNANGFTRLSEFSGDLITLSGSTLSKWDGTTLTDFTGSYSNPSATVTMKFAQQNQNLYFTTSNGVYKLDLLSNEPVLAGVPAALDVQATINGSSGFLAIKSSVSYRIVWGITDGNQNLILGAPSAIAQLDNSSGSQTANANVIFTIPQGITLNHFYQVYRSDQIAFTGSTPNTPDDNMQLVYEANPTSGQLAALSVTVVDITPDSLRGAALYTNATQEGILQQNTIPPFCNDICSFKNCLFFANVSNAQNLNITMLAVGGSLGVGVGDTITIGANTFTSINTTPVTGSNNYEIFSSGSPSQNVNQTALNLVATINQSTTNTTIYAYYISNSTSLPGQILLVNRNYATSAFNVTASAHGSAWSPALPTSGTTIVSTNTIALNGLMYSKQQEPEAVPALNIFYPGSANQKILRILALRDSLFILKQDGVFRLSGTSPSNFVIDTLDNTVFIAIPDSAVALNNCVYAYTTQGVAQITDSGISIVSRPIEDQLNQISGTVGAANQSAYAFGVAYESEREYQFWTPQTSTDTSATIAYVYNYFTKTWVTKARAQKCGYVFSGNNRLYLGNALSITVSEERKDYSFTDYTDESITVNIVSTSGTTINLTSAANVSVGDVLYQSLGISSLVTAVNIGLNTIQVEYNLTWQAGATQLLKSFACVLQWVPSTGQNPGMIKQYSEGLLIFKSSPFISATVSYLSDISTSSQGILIHGESPLGWGLFPWGLAVWGAVGITATARHYIPRDKQRCTLLTPQFSMRNGWSNFLLEGLSLQYREVSSRTMR